MEKWGGEGKEAEREGGMRAGQERGGAAGSAEDAGAIGWPLGGGVSELRAGGGAGGAGGDLTLHSSVLGVQEPGEMCPCIPEPSECGCRPAALQGERFLLRC